MEKFSIEGRGSFTSEGREEKLLYRRKGRERYFIAEREGKGIILQEGRGIM